MAALLRRRVALLLVLAAVLALVPATALSSGRAVLSDYRDNGRIDRCYTLAEYQQALRLVRPDQAQYGALVDVILNAQVTNLKVPGQPCRPKPAAVTTTSSGGSSSSTTWIWVLVVIAVVVVAIGAGALVRRKRGGGGDGDEGDGDDGEGGGQAPEHPAEGDGGTDA